MAATLFVYVWFIKKQRKFTSLEYIEGEIRRFFNISPATHRNFARFSSLTVWDKIGGFCLTLWDFAPREKGDFMQENDKSIKSYVIERTTGEVMDSIMEGDRIRITRKEKVEFLESTISIPFTSFA